MADSAELFFSGCPGTLVVFSSQNLPILTPAIGTAPFSVACALRNWPANTEEKLSIPSKGVTLAKGKISKVKILEGYSVVSGSMSGERSESLFSSGRHVRSFQGSPAKQIFDVSRVQAL